ncbi:MAG: ubiquinol-cytochrome c reductase iron-sulfur subunit [Pirellulales bacterium]
MAEKRKMSVAEILAAARKSDGGEAPAGAAASGSEGAPSESPSPGSPSGEKVAAKPQQRASEEKTGAKPPAPKAEGKRPSVAEMLAMARGDAGGAGKADSEPKAKEPKRKPATAKPAKGAAKAKPASPAAGKPGPKSTATILAAARQEREPGPISKAEAKAPGGVGPPKPARTRRVAPPMPDKPDYARAKGATSTSRQEGTSRRGFVLAAIFGSFLAIGFSSLAATLGLWTLGMARFMFPNVLREPPSRFKVGFPDNFAPGQVETKFKAQFGVWVVHWEYEGQPQIYALKTVCTHLGCTPNWLEAEQKFKCPCHGSGFYKDGVNFEGPAPRPLERYAIRLADDGQLEIDKSKTFQEELGQWADPTSFVTA